VVSSEELKKIMAAGFKLSVLVDDMQADFLKRNAVDKAQKPQDLSNLSPSCDNLGNWHTPKNWKYGTMGGHLNYDEALAQLDSMHKLYPQLITAKSAIGLFQTAGGRRLYWLRMNGKASKPDTSQPEILFTALHHAREPVSLHQLVFFMWTLLENYGKDSVITSLVDHTQIYFIPIINPDGYAYNASNAPNGGGFWRKNRRRNIDNSFGVDLNRNYGKFWGFDDIGSSPLGSSDTYRGPFAFSEPETQAVRSFCHQHHFRLCLNYHTYANTLIFPTNTPTTAQTPDSTTFWYVGKAATRESHFFVSGTFESLNYTVNGTSDDYMYWPDSTKSSIISFTPEVGNASEDGFWPVQSRILPLSQRTQYQNMSVLRSVHPHVVFKDSTGLFLRAGYGKLASKQRIKFKLIRTGVVDKPAQFSLTIKPFGAGHASLVAIKKTYSIAHINKEITDSIFIPDGAIGSPTGIKLGYEIGINNGLFTTKDTIYHYNGIPQSNNSLRDYCDDLANWVTFYGTQDFMVEATNQAQGNGCIYDSYEYYKTGMSEKRMLFRIILFDLRAKNIVAAELSMLTRYKLLRTYEGMALQLSTDSGNTWANSCTDATTHATSRQSQYSLINASEDASVWAGNKTHWSREYLNLADYLPADGKTNGPKLWISFYEAIYKDPANTGFLLDDIMVRYVVPDVVTETNPVFGTPAFSVLPNPFQSQLEVEQSNQGELTVFNSLGMQMSLQMDKSSKPGYVLLNTESLPSGLYVLRQGAHTARVVK
jgi:hypothetical protein